MAKSLQDLQSEITALGDARKTFDAAHADKVVKAQAVTDAQTAYSNALAAEGTAKSALEALAASVEADIDAFAKDPSPDPTPAPAPAPTPTP